MLGLGLSLTNFGSKGGIADVADGGSLAALMLASETQGLAIDFTDLSMVVKDTGTPANAFAGDPNSKLTYASPSTKWVLGRSGLYESGTTLRTEYNASGVALGVRIEEARTNLFLNSRAPLTQSITTTAQSYTISGVGAVGATIVFSGTATGTLTGTAALAGDTLTFTATAGTLTCTVTGTWDFVQVEAGAFRTSPIVTAGSTVTRAADRITFSGFTWNNNTGTLFVKSKLYDTNAFLGSGAMLAQISQTAISGFAGVMVFTDSLKRHGFRVRQDGGTSTILETTTNGSSLNPDAYDKSAVAYATGDSAAYENTTQVGISASAHGIMTLQTLSVGGSPAGGFSVTGHIAQIMYLPRRMTNAELVTVTT